MDQETLDFHNWELQRYEAERIREALKAADSGRLIEHSRLKAMAADWCKTDESELDQVVASSGRSLKISWSQVVVDHLQRLCEDFGAGWDSHGMKTRVWVLSQVLSTAELIASYPEIGRPGLVEGTREWGVEFGMPTVAYRRFAGEIQVLGSFVSHRKWPLMKSASFVRPA